MENSRFNLNRYAEPKTEEDKRTLAKHGYRALSTDEALELAEKLGKSIVGKKALGRVQNLIKGEEGELRFYTELGATSLGRTCEGEGVYVRIKEADRVLPIITRKPDSRLKLE